MISMLIYSCKQDEIELLEETARDVVAVSGDERLEIIAIRDQKEENLEKLVNADLAFVDVTKPSGLQFAKELRGNFRNVEIMIISDQTVSPVAYLTPDIRPASLLLKPLTDVEVEKGIRDLFDILFHNEDKQGQFFVVEYEKEQKRIPYSKILYFEARGGKVYVRMQSEEYGLYETLDMLEQQLSDDFKRCHRGFIVNLLYVSKVWYSKNIIQLKNDLQIPLSRTYKSVMKEVLKSGT